MNEATRWFLWTTAGAGGLSALGAGFGALAGRLHWKAGRPSGTALGLGVLRSFARASEDELSPGASGAIVGGADGAAFGLVLGAGVGLLLGPRAGEWVPPVLLIACGLAAVALALGLFASAVARLGGPALIGMFVGCLMGAFAGLAHAGATGLMVGAVGGAGLGVAWAWLWRASRP